MAFRGILFRPWLFSRASRTHATPSTSRCVSTLPYHRFWANLHRRPTRSTPPGSHPLTQLWPWASLLSVGTIRPLSTDTNADKPPGEYVLNVGRCTETLRGELTDLFRQGLQDTTIYHPEVVLVEPYHTHLHLGGRQVYLLFMRCFIHILKWSYTEIDFRIVRMEQRPGEWNDGSSLPPSSSVIPPGSQPFRSSAVGHDLDPPPGVARVAGTDESKSHDKGMKPPALEAVHLYVRWSFEAVLRPSRLFSPGGDAPKSRYDGVFIYSFDPATGLISKHTIVEVFPYPDERLIRYLERWWGWAFQPPVRTIP